MERAVEQPTWTLLLNPDGKILAVRQEFADEKVEMGWLVVARESELLPFNPPRIICEPNDNTFDGA